MADFRGRLTRGLTRGLARELAPAVASSRLLLGAKAAVAVVLAWWLGSLLPGAIDDYAYYAPLGAIISMTPTLMGSLRASVQTAVGLAIGIALAWGVIAVGAYGPLGMAIAVGLGVLLAGIRRLGRGASYIPIAALFVLLIGGSQPDSYSVGYIAQMGLGMAIGIAVNLLIVPPLYLKKSAAEISELRTTIAGVLDDIGRALVESWPPAHSDWSARLDSLESLVRDAESIIADARESRRINPRARRHPYDIDEDFDDLKTLERLVAHTVDLGEAISGAIWQQPVPVGLPDELLEPLSDAVTKTGELIRAWDSRDDEAAATKEADRALHALTEKFNRHARGGGEPSEAVGSIIFTLRGTLTLLESRLRARREG